MFLACCDILFAKLQEGCVHALELTVLPIPSWLGSPPSQGWDVGGPQPPHCWFHPYCFPDPPPSNHLKGEGYMSMLIVLLCPGMVCNKAPDSILEAVAVMGLDVMRRFINSLINIEVHVY